MIQEETKIYFFILFAISPNLLLRVYIGKGFFKNSLSPLVAVLSQESNK